MSRVKDYKVITSGGGWEQAIANLESSVRKYIAGGWEPLGPPVRVDSSYWYQAMVKYEVNTPPNTGPKP